MPGALPAKVKKNRRTHAWILLASGRGALPIDRPQRKQRSVKVKRLGTSMHSGAPGVPPPERLPCEDHRTATKTKVINKRLTPRADP
jgi:hypothetical protein